MARQPAAPAEGEVSASRFHLTPGAAFSVCTERAKLRETLPALAAPLCLAPRRPDLGQTTLFFWHIINPSVSLSLSPSPCLPLNHIYLY